MDHGLRGFQDRSDVFVHDDKVKTDGINRDGVLSRKVLEYTRQERLGEVEPGDPENFWSVEDYPLVQEAEPR